MLHDDRISDMENPWTRLSDLPPYIPAVDKTQINAFNHQHRHNDQRLLQLDIRPEPYIGSLNAPIVLLYLNPGYTPDDMLLHQDPTGEALWWSNIYQSFTGYPFYMLDPHI